jgi:hypothetical protein
MLARERQASPSAYNHLQPDGALLYHRSTVEIAISHASTVIVLDFVGLRIKVLCSDVRQRCLWWRGAERADVGPVGAGAAAAKPAHRCVQPGNILDRWFRHMEIASMLHRAHQTEQFDTCSIWGTPEFSNFLESGVRYTVLTQRASSCMTSESQVR